MTTEQESPPTHRAWSLSGSLSGSVGALVGFLLGVTPSLVPRPPLFLGLVAGVCAAIGYGTAVALASALHRIGVPEIPAARRRPAWLAMTAVSVAVVASGLALGARWQNEIRTSLGVDTTSGGFVVAALVAGGAFLGLLALARYLRRLSQRTARRLPRRWPAAAAGAAAGVIVAIGCAAVLAASVAILLEVTDRIYENKNATSAEGVLPTQELLRSGGPQSLIAWDSLGREGRAFIASGPTAATIEEVTGRTSLEPIRAYVGLDSAPTAQERAALAVAELDRTGAFDRSVLIVCGVAGTGWLEPQSIDSVEYIHGGDTAIVASQYSYLPSWISTLVDTQRAREEGSALFEAVWEKWRGLPEEDRPQLIVYGLSLGSYSMQSAFTDSADLAGRTDGAVLAGTPSATQPWRTLGDTRDPGSPLWQPVVDGGETFRFADDDADWQALGPWSPPRVAYLQHADDPVVWWGFPLIASRPDWLAEPHGPAVSPRMRWIPVITFLQVTVDQFFGVNQPNGFGHNYSLHMAGTWLAVVGAPPGWTPEDTAKVQQKVLGGT